MAFDLKSIADKVVIDLPHPWDMTSKEFIDLREYITEQIKWW